MCYLSLAALSLLNCLGQSFSTLRSKRSLIAIVLESPPSTVAGQSENLEASYNKLAIVGAHSFRRGRNGSVLISFGSWIFLF